MKKTGKRSWIRIFAVVLAAAFVAGAVLSAVLFKVDPSRTYARATLQMTFNGAADGIAPNGRLFNIGEMASDRVLSSALEASGLAGQISVEALRGSLYIQGSYPADMLKQVMSYESLMDFTVNREVTVNDYHPTQFMVNLYDDFGLKKAQLTGLLDSVMKAYADDFAATYSLTVSAPAYTGVLDPAEIDYAQRISVLETNVDQLTAYAQAMTEKDPSVAVDGIGGFSDIAVRLTNLRQNDLETLSARVSADALSMDVGRLLSQYNYQVQVSTNQLEAQKARLERLDKLIASYDKNEVIYLSTTDSLTKIDGNSSQTYDQLIDLRKQTSEGITQIQARIDDYTARINVILGTDETEQADSDSEDGSLLALLAGGEDKDQSAEQDDMENAVAEAQELLREKTEAFEAAFTAVVKKRDGVIADFAALLKAFNDRQINSGTFAVTAAKYFTPRYLSSAFAVKVLKTAGPICALALMGCLTALVISRRREEKLKNA